MVTEWANRDEESMRLELTLSSYNREGESKLIVNYFRTRLLVFVKKFWVFGLVDG